MISIGIIFAVMLLTVLHSYHLLEFKSDIKEEIAEPTFPELTFNSFLGMRVNGITMRDLISEYLITGDDNIKTIIKNKFNDMFGNYKAVLVFKDQTLNPNNIDLNGKHYTAFRKIAVLGGYENIQLRFYK